MAFIGYSPTPTKLVTLSYADGSEPLSAATTNVSLEQLANGVAWGNNFADTLFSSTHTWSALQTFSAGLSVTAGTTTIGGSAVFNGVVTLNQALAVLGSAPSVTADPGANVFYNANIPKVFGRIITDGLGGWSIPSSGLNLGLATVTATYVDVDFVRAFANAEYAAVVTNISGTSDVPHIDYANSTTTKIRLQMRDSAGALRNPSTTVCRWSLMIMGRH